MKIKLLILLFVLSLKTFAQTKFSQGFSRGFKKGYCYNQGLSCIEPIAPISPIPKIGESSNSYEDGYNNGFELGITSQKNLVKTTKQRYTSASYEFDNAIQKINLNDIIKLVPILKLAKEKAIDFSDNGDYLSAIKLAKSGLKISPKDDEFMMIIGVAYLELENYSEGLVYLKKAVLRTNDPEIKSVIKEIESGEYQKNIEKNKS